MIDKLRIGCAGWTIPKVLAGSFPGDSTHLERYAERLTCVEINSSFYKPHREQTYARWAASVPDDFSFSVKLSREITHECCLADTGSLLDAFLEQVSGLGGKLGAVLVQLPPSLPFDANVAGAFFHDMRKRYKGGLVCEPRHRSWFESDAERLLAGYQVGRVAADPAVVPSAAAPGGWSGIAYYRLHGSPRIYYSQYSVEFMEALVARICARPLAASGTWCIFDNTALGAATGDALLLCERLEDRRKTQ